MSKQKLLPCPFCGGEAKTYKSIIGFGVRCDTPFCCDITATRKTEEEAIADWNHRKPMDDIVERLEEEKEEYKDHWKQSNSDVYYGAFIGLSDAIGIVKGEV